tara:strand:- start:825 stop:1559 length:735 start_codon:yes stop_codon:yes gene_type:complete
MNQTLFKLVILMLTSLSLTSYSLETAAKTTGQQTGTWENKDEDGDGVPDDQDDYPFDAAKSEFFTLQESEFKIPHEISQFSVQLQNGWGKGNSHRLKIKNEFSIRLSAPKALSSRYDRLYYDAADGNVKEFNASGVTVVDLPALNDPMLTLYVKKDAEYIKLYALAIQGNDVQTVSLDTTLFAWLTYGHPKLTLESMKTNPSYPALYEYVYNQLQQDIYFFSFADANAQNAFFEKLRAFGNDIE